MELLRRERGDELLKPGRFTELRARLRRIAPGHDLTSVIACAFDHRTRMLPFIYADTRMAPAGVRGIGSAMLDAGFEKTRIVLQQWNRRFAPSQMRLDGRVPDLFMVSSMQIHSAECRRLIQEACRIDPGQRPLIIAGGPKCIYEPWDVFNADPAACWGADVAVTGEEYVLLNLLEVLLSVRAKGETMRSAFLRARDGGLLDEVPGLVYARGQREGLAEELVDTGMQRLLGDLDELPHPALGYSLLDPPGHRPNLAPRALSADQVRRYSPVSSLVLTFGCKFACPYCPIPAYNQRQHRVKSGERIADEFIRLNQEYGLRYFFGADDNFFNSRQRTLEIVETLARKRIGGNDIRKRVRWATEVTVHDTLQLRDHLATVRKAGVRALWLGVEDLTATLVKKGQSPDKTQEAFGLLRRHGICPMPMMMHHDEQPLYTRGKPYGLLNQVRLLRQAGAVSLQVLMMTPATGSKLYAEAFTSGLAYESVDGRRVEPHMLDANYVVASRHPRPWRKQFNIMAAYLYFYNPLRFLWALVRPKSKLYLADALVQLYGMWGTGQTIRRTLGWALRLMRGRIVRKTEPPYSRIPMRDARGGPASHAQPGTPISDAGTRPPAPARAQRPAAPGPAREPLLPMHAARTRSVPLQVIQTV
ncbi:MAG: hypothetical protein AMXMBFR83_11970 [Phycisphaerae bacterium]